MGKKQTPRTLPNELRVFVNAVRSGEEFLQISETPEDQTEARHLIEQGRQEARTKW